MQSNSQTYEQLTLPFTEDLSTCSQEVFPVNRFQLPESKKEPKMTATCGPKCSELFGLFDPVGSWARTFTGLLVGRTGWYSNRCALTWKRKVTKSSRMYFQLAVSALPTKGTGHGLLLKTQSAFDATVSSPKKNPKSGDSGSLAQEIMCGYATERRLWKTPTASDAADREFYVNNRGEPQLSAQAQLGFPVSGKNWQMMLPTVQTQGLKMCENGKTKFYPVGLLPTPRTKDIGRGSVKDAKYENGVFFRENKQGVHWGVQLPDLIASGLPPTPMDGDCRSGMQNRVGRNHTQQLNGTVASQTGETSQLNPLFVEEMMGFPTGWILTPFLKESQHPGGPKPTTGGGSRPSKPTETP